MPCFSANAGRPVPGTMTKLRLPCAVLILLLCGSEVPAAEYEGWWATNRDGCLNPRRSLAAGRALQVEGGGLRARGLSCSFENVVGADRTQIDIACTSHEGERKRLTASLLADGNRLIFRRAGAERGLEYVRCGRPAPIAGGRGRRLAVRIEEAGEKLLAQGEHLKAEEAFGRAIQEAPGYDSAWNNRGFARRLQGRYSEAVSDYSEAIRLDPRAATYLSNRGVALDGMDKLEASLRDFEAALEIDPDHQMALNGRGSVLRQLGRASQALPDLEKAVRLNPTYVVALNNLGLAYRDVGERGKAVEAFTRALSANPGSAFALKERGRIHLDDRRYVEAVGDFTKALGVDPTDRQALNSRGVGYLKLCEFAKALVDFDEALAVEAKFAVARWGRGLALEGLGSRQAALDALDRAAVDDSALSRRSDFSADRARLSGGLSGVAKSSSGGCSVI